MADRTNTDNQNSDTERNLPTRPAPVPPPRPPRGRHAPPPAQPPPPNVKRRRLPPDRRKRSRQRTGLHLPLWSIALMLLIVAGIACGLVLLVINLGGNRPPAAQPVVIVNSPMPTETPASYPLSPATPTIPPDLDPGIIGVPPQPPASFQLFGPTLEAIATSTPTPPPLAVGVTVIVADVYPDQLNVRNIPTTRDSTILFRADEGTRFTLVDGPQQADGFTWWQIQNTTNANEIGWAVSNYLEVAVDQ